MVLKKALKPHAHLCDHYREGLKAVDSKDKDCIEASNTSALCGSLCLDSIYKKKEPNAARWDYLVCYDGKVYAIEVHPAYDSDISEVIEKAKWLRAFLRKHESIEKVTQRRFLWAHKGKNAIRDRNLQSKLAAFNVELSTRYPLVLPYVFKK